MKKSKIVGGNIKVVDEGKTKSNYTIDYVIFDPKDPVTADGAKKLVASRKKIGFSRVKDEYDVIYALAYTEKMGRRKVTEYKICKKAEANCIFVVPKKWKKDAKKVVSEYFNFAL